MWLDLFFHVAVRFFDGQFKGTLTIFLVEVVCNILHNLFFLIADFLKVLAKELRVSAIVGAVLGVVNGLRIYLMYTFIFAGQYDNVMGYAIVVSVSLFFSVILAKLVGGMLPLAAKKLGADPAIMATPFITTIVDACSLILYFQIAQVVFRNMM